MKAREEEKKSKKSLSRAAKRGGHRGWWVTKKSSASSWTGRAYAHLVGSRKTWAGYSRLLGIFSCWLPMLKSKKNLLPREGNYPYPRIPQKAHEDGLKPTNQSKTLPRELKRVIRRQTVVQKGNISHRENAS